MNFTCIKSHIALYQLIAVCLELELELVIANAPAGFLILFTCAATSAAVPAPPAAFSGPAG